jgi:hypothetical protein
MHERLAERRLIAADPVADRDLTSDLARVRRRLLVDIERPVARARRRRRLPAALAATAAAAVVAAYLPSVGDDRVHGVLPAPVQAFADDLAGDGVLHMVTRTSSVADAGGRQIRTPVSRVELWYELGGQRWRLRSRTEGSPAFAEWVSDGRRLDGLDPALAPSWLPALRAALHAGATRTVSAATVQGRPAYRVVLDLVPRDASTADTHVFVARGGRHALLRVDRRSRSPLPVATRSDVLVYDVLPDTAEHRRLLEPTRAAHRERTPPSPFRGLPLTTWPPV